ncbi:MAG: hypothetical protein M0Z56_07170, partial [Desulfobacteraceae bacterium]|nr:hypothetical protein [Desulfobacteraceae bacterium]
MKKERKTRIKTSGGEMKTIGMRMAIIAAVITTFFLNYGAFCEPVKGYSSYIQLLPGGKDKEKPNLTLIEKSKEDVVAAEAEKKNREIKFDRPVDILVLNSRYTMISFEVFIKNKDNSRFSPNPSIFGLLFEGTGRSGLSRYTSRYIKWVGKDDIEEYHNSQIKDLCGYFRRVGVDDCVAEGGGGKSVSEAPKMKESSGGWINADRISSGTVKADRIDRSIARKNDVEKAIEASSGKIDRLNSVIAAQNDKIGSLTNEIKAMAAAGTDAKHLDERFKAMDKYNERFKQSLQTTLSGESSLEALFKTIGDSYTENLSKEEMGKTIQHI